MNDFQRDAVIVAIEKMLYGNKHFSICDFDKIASLLDRDIGRGNKDYQALHALHCVDWSTMGHALAEQVRLKAIDLLSTEVFRFNRSYIETRVIDAAPPAPPPARFRSSGYVTQPTTSKPNRLLRFIHRG